MSVSGPFFSEAYTNAVVANAVRRAEDETAQAGKMLVDAFLATSIRNPTPYYQTKIATKRDSRGAIVHDDMVIYGPWLEGVGSRNKETRFKGYFSFRRAAQAVGPVAQEIVNRAGMKIAELLA